MNYGNFFYEKATFLFWGGKGGVIRKPRLAIWEEGGQKCQKQDYVVYGRSLEGSADREGV